MTTNKTSFDQTYEITGVYYEAKNSHDYDYDVYETQNGSRVILFHPNHGWRVRYAVFENSMDQMYQSLGI